MDSPLAVPASIAGLEPAGSWVWVGPPLPVSAPRTGSCPVMFGLPATGVTAAEPGFSSRL